VSRRIVTLPYDGAIVQEYQRGSPLPASRWSSVTVPTVVVDRGKSPTWMRNGNRALANILPNAQYRTIEGQTHNVKPKAPAPVLVEFFQVEEEDEEAVGSQTSEVEADYVNN
jgi:hypothetical protein